MTQKEKIIDYIQGMTDERLHEVFNCQNESPDNLWDCPYWDRKGKYCKNPNVCHKIPFERDFERQQREAEKRAPQQEQGLRLIFSAPQVEQGALFK